MTQTPKVEKKCSWLWFDGKQWQVTSINPLSDEAIGVKPNYTGVMLWNNADYVTALEKTLKAANKLLKGMVLDSPDSTRSKEYESYQDALAKVDV